MTTVSGHEIEVIEPRDEPRAVLFDFGGVLTSSVLESFASFSSEVSGDPDALIDLLTHDEGAHAALVDHECGRVEDEVFEAAVVAGFATRGVTVEAEGLIARMQSRFEPDAAMIELVGQLRTHGIAVALVSNSLGRDCYAGYDLDALFEVQAISGHEGVRKPSRELYEIACRGLDVPPTTAVMIDDLAVNIEAASRLGMGGIVHRESDRTKELLREIFGLPADTLG